MGPSNDGLNLGWRRKRGILPTLTYYGVKMTKRRFVAACALLSALCPDLAGAGDLIGAWANDSAVCDKIYVRRNNRLSFADNADAFGSGFIFEENRIRGKFASCAIKARKQDGQTINLIAVCSTDVAVDTAQFTLKFVDDNTLVRMFPGMPEMEMTFVRCPS